MAPGPGPDRTASEPVPGVPVPAATEAVPPAVVEPEEDWEAVVAAVVQRMESTISRT